MLWSKVTIYKIVYKEVLFKTLYKTLNNWYKVIIKNIYDRKKLNIF